MTDREKLDKLNVSVSATLVEKTHCICDMCHGTGKVIAVLIPETKYRPKDKKMLLVNEPIRMWMCESCRDKLLRAISIPFQEPKRRSPMSDREKLVDLIDEVAEGTVFASAGEQRVSINSDDIADHLLANGVTVNNWRDAKTDPPKSGEHVLVCCEVMRMDGSAGNRYVCDGFYAAKHTEIAYSCGDGFACEYSEADDEWYLLEGWYEVVKNWDEYNSIAIADFVVGWMPLPEPMKKEGSE